MTNSIPLIDLKAQYESIKPEISDAILRVIDSCAFIQGEEAKQFADSFACELGSGHVVACSNGTSALSIALETLGVGAGDEVVVPSHTFIATAEAVMHVNAKPVFADVDRDTALIGLNQIKATITEKTKAVVVVHLYGNVCELKEIEAFCKERGLLLIEDTAQAHFAKYDGRYAGTFGDASTFSFYPGKNLGAYGDAGAIWFSSKAKADLAAKLVDHGRKEKYSHDIVGYNHRMDEIQAAVLSVKLKYIHQWSEQRRIAAQKYNHLFSETGFRTIKINESVEPVYHLFVVECSNRDEVLAHLKSKSIGAAIHYPIPVHRQEAFANYKMAQVQLPNTEEICSRILSLPLFPEITDKQIRIVYDHFCEAAKL